MKKKVLALCLVLCMVLSMLPMTANAAQPRKLRIDKQMAGAVGTLEEAAVSPNARSYPVTLTSSGNGEARLFVDSPVQAGDAVFFLADPADGYLADVYYSGLAEGELVYVGEEIWGFYMPNNAVELEVEFVPAQGSNHSITVYTEDRNGAYAVTREEAKAGESIVLGVLPYGDGFDPDNDIWAIGALDCFNYYVDEENGIYYFDLLMGSEDINIFLNYGSDLSVTTVVEGDPNGGTVTLSDDQAKTNDLILVDVVPNPGYSVSYVKAKSFSGALVEDVPYYSEYGVYAFEMHPGDVEVHVCFEDNRNTVAVTVENGLGGTAALSHEKAGAGETVTLTCTPDEGYRVARITGVQNLTDNGDGTYTFTMPNKAVNIQVLFLRNENPFFDVNETHFFYESVLWAVEEGITSGLSPIEFGPFAVCNRAQVVTFLWRYAGSPEPENTNNPFTDVPAGSFYHKAVLWAVEEGITNGVSATEFGPNLACNRAQVVTFLWRLMGQPEPTLTENPFTDVEPGWYEKPVLWALEKGITTGATANTFNPNGQCQRAQVVTFLYRTAQLPAPEPEPDPDADYAFNLYSNADDFDDMVGFVYSDATSYKAGEQVIFYAEPDFGYLMELETVPADLELTYVGMGYYEMTMPAKDVTITANFYEAPGEYHYITGSVSARDCILICDADDEGNFVAKAGEHVYVYIRPNSAHTFSEADFSMTANGQPYENWAYHGLIEDPDLGDYHVVEFVMPDTDVELKIVSGDPTPDPDASYAFNLLSNDPTEQMGFVYGLGDSYKAGDVVYFLADPSFGYLMELETSPADLELFYLGDSCYAMYMPSEDVTITATFYEAEGDYHYIDGTVSNCACDIVCATDEQGAFVAKAGEHVTLYITPNSGYELSGFSITVDGQIYDAWDYYGLIEDPDYGDYHVVEFIMPDADVELQIVCSAAAGADGVKSFRAPFAAPNAFLAERPAF